MSRASAGRTLFETEGTLHGGIGTEQTAKDAVPLWYYRQRLPAGDRRMTTPTASRTAVQPLTIATAAPPVGVAITLASRHEADGQRRRLRERAREVFVQAAYPVRARRMCTRRAIFRSRTRLPDLRVVCRYRCSGSRRRFVPTTGCPYRDRKILARNSFRSDRVRSSVLANARPHGRRVFRGPSSSMVGSLRSKEFDDNQARYRMDAP